MHFSIVLGCNLRFGCEDVFLSKDLVIYIYWKKFSFPLSAFIIKARKKNCNPSFYLICKYEMCWSDYKVVSENGLYSLIMNVYNFF